MAIEIGSVVEGTITGVSNFGAFVDLGEGKVGLVHISQISHSYVKDINEFVKIGDKVKVKVVAQNQQGKYDLSIKQANPTTEDMKYLYKPKGKSTKDRPMPGTFEDKITQFLKQSEEKLLDLKKNITAKQSGGKKKKFT